MSINIGDKPEMNVVNVGDELTADQLAALQNAQGASATNPCLTSTNTFNTADAAVRITQTGTGDAFRITNTGTGNSFVVEDSASTDTSPFVIDAAGNVAIGTPFPVGYKLNVIGIAQVSAISGSSVFRVDNSGAGGVATFTNTATATADAVRITNLGTGNSFVVEDSTSPDSSPFVINADGNVGIGTASIGARLVVNGAAIFSGISSGSLYNFTQNGTGTLAVFANNATSTADAVRITNLGTGNSFVVEDDTNPDSSPFVISADGNVGIGITTPSTKLAVIGTSSFAGATSVSTSGSNAFTVSVTNTSSGVIGSLIDYRGTGNAFRIVNNTTETFNITGSGAVTLTNYLTLHSGALATSVGSQTYPDELELKVGSTTYRVPARAI